MTVVDDEPAGDGFDHYARLVRRLLGAPIATVTLIEPDRQVYLGASGLPEPLQRSRQTPLEDSICAYVVDDAAPLVVEDLRDDERLHDHPAVTGMGAQAYAGWPITGPDEQVVGSLCALDTRPHAWTAEQVEILRDLALACSVELRERDLRVETARALAEAEELGERSRALLALSTGLAGTATLSEVAGAVVTVSTEQLGCLRAGMWLRTPAQMTAGPARPRLGEPLGFRADHALEWQSARTFAELPVDETNPLGLALVQEGPVYYQERAAQDTRFPHLVNPHQLGEARAFLPLVLGGRAYGALALVWPRRRAFTDPDRATLEALASYTAQAVHRAVLLEDRIDAAVTLQTALLSRLPAPGPLEMAARYRPADTREQVGGDWYDAFAAPDGATHLVIGDVAGHDVGAAAAMGQLRSMLRMAAWGSAGPPSHDLGRLDDAMQDLGVEALASAVLARLGPAGEEGAPAGARRLTWSNAGHPPPLLLDADGARFLGCRTAPHGPMLGVLPGLPRTDDGDWLRPGAMLLLYTDGLVERRGESIDAGLERLREAAAGLDPADVDGALDQLLDEVAGSRTVDDTAVLAVRLAG